MNGLDIIKARAFGAGSGGSGGSGGGSELLDALIDGSITEVVSDAKKIKEDVFKYCTQLTIAYFSEAISVGNCAFVGCHKLSTAKFEAASTVNEGAFQNCGGIATVYFSSKVSIGRYALYGCPALTALILRSAELCTISHTDSLGSTPIKNGTGYIYVPSALVDTYKAATNWSTYASQFRALEDYTVDGTITGELDPEKIGA